MKINNIKPQELLTGKAKVAFLKWLRSNYPLGASVLEWNTIREQFLHSLIIDCLDSSGIYVLVTDFDGEDWWCEVNGYKASLLGETRHQATQEAIKKAVEIYNNRGN